MITVNNNEFITAIFGEYAPICHVTDFPYAPDGIPKDKHLIAWKGDYYSRYRFEQNTNQYFTISTFDADEQGIARRRKALYQRTHCIVLDDVKEKLSEVEAAKLPTPSWILETSVGSEQWGYILDTPCTEAHRIDNLNDGLIASDLAPSGKDPGQRGVTRYVRLPEGINNKLNKLVNGQPFKCRMLSWQPFQRVSLEDIAAPFNINLDAQRREQRVDGAANVEGHPLLKIPEIISVKEVRSDGRFDITCPWVDEHTGADDSGSAVFTNEDGSIGFKCHHGACQHRTGRDLLLHIEGKSPGFGTRFASWKGIRAFTEISNISFMDERKENFTQVSFIDSGTTAAASLPVPTVGQEQPVSFIEAQAEENGLDLMVDSLRRERPTTEEARQLAAKILKIVEELPAMDKHHYHSQVCDLMQWSKQDFKSIIRDLREQWFSDSRRDAEFYDDMIFVREQNQFYNFHNQIFYSTEAFQNSYSDQDADARKVALQDGRVHKVDKIDYAPKKPRIFTERGITYGNTWDETSISYGQQGDASPWLNHFDALGWGGQKKHILQWMAYTVLYPDKKINHMLILGSGEGCGKDFLLRPLVEAMGNNSTTIEGDTLLSDFNEYLLGTKFLNVNETELGDRREAMAISNKLKPIAAAPPDHLRINQKGIKPVKVRNIVNVVMTTNSQLPIRISGTSRRIYAVWSDLETRDASDTMTPEWVEYWSKMWTWMNNGGAEYCIWYLRNCVDLSDFKPASPPPMTDFLRDIKEASKSPQQQTIEALIAARVGAFSSDLVTSDEINETIRTGGLSAPHCMYCDSSWFTPTKVGLILKDIKGCAKLRGHHDMGGIRLWAIRDLLKYRNMSPVVLYAEYQKQIQASRQNASMTVVK